MKIHTNITQANGAICLVLQPSFVGDLTDPTDKALIAAFGDPEVNIAGQFTDPNNTPFTFGFPTTEQYVGVTTQLSSQVVRFMLALPQGAPFAAGPVQGPLDCITPNPSEAATAWQSVMITRISAVFATLRGTSLMPTILDASI